MNPLRRLAGQTAIYGLSTIVGRLLNYFLVPIYTRVFLPQEYGVVSVMYAFVTFAYVVYTYGMETAFFRHYHMEEDKEKVYDTSLISIITSSIILAGTMILFSDQIAGLIKYPGKGIYVTWFALILGLDAIVAIPFNKLRAEHKAKRFASVKFLNIIFNIIFNLFFLILCPMIMKGHNETLQSLINPIYSKEVGVGYIFISNLISSFLTLIILTPELLKLKLKFDTNLWKRMIVYAFPLLIGGFAGMINETIDRLLLKYLIPDKAIAEQQVGIYSACYKVSILMTLFIMTFRQAAEPFFFAEAKSENAKKIYADVMKFFIIACSIIFLGVMMNMEIVKYYVGEKYRSGLKVVPILLIANLCLGVFFNLSIWYKLSGHTKFGAYLAIYGATVTLILNFWWIPIIGYMGAAWATLICYASMMILSYFIGQKFYPVDYNLKMILVYFGIALGIYFISTYSNDYFQLSRTGTLLFNNVFLIAFLYFAWLIEKPNLVSFKKKI